MRNHNISAQMLWNKARVDLLQIQELRIPQQTYQLHNKRVEDSQALRLTPFFYQKIEPSYYKKSRVNWFQFFDVGLCIAWKKNNADWSLSYSTYLLYFSHLNFYCKKYRHDCSPTIKFQKLPNGRSDKHL